MSRVAINPVPIPDALKLTRDGSLITLEKGNRSLSLEVHPSVSVVEQDGQLLCAAIAGVDQAKAMSGTMRALISNMVEGLTTGFKKELQLVGVGYRARVSNNVVHLSLGFSHPVEYAIPEGIEIVAPSATELVISGANKQQVGQVAAEIRAFRPPEPYKGKGVRYKGEFIKLKEGKSK